MSRELFQAIHRTDDRTADRCQGCDHGWHGLPCEAARCLCLSAYEDTPRKEAR